MAQFIFVLILRWGQECYYNAECPECVGTDNCEDQCYRAAVGCVAVAMGQIMRYHEYPDYGYGDTSYYSGYENYYIDVDFENIYYNWVGMTRTFYYMQHHNGPIALYHCGASVGMSYGESSGAITPQAINALKNHFNYAATAEYVIKENYSSSPWIQILKSELDSERPILYRGQGTGYHAWVCDGYDSYNRFFMNWGWEGIDNGWYPLNDLNPPNHDNFEDHQKAIIKITPPEYAEIPYSNGFESGSFDESWITRCLDGYGRMVITNSYYPHSGNYHMTMDVSQSGHYACNEALLLLDLSGLTNIELNFWWKDFSDEYNEDKDGVFFR